MAVQKYIQDPNNPSRSIPNPVYKEEVTTPTQGEMETATEQTQPKVSKMTLADLGITQTPEAKEIDKIQKGLISMYPTTLPDEEGIRRKTLDTFQQEIDALEMAKKQRLQDIERTSQERLAKSLGGSRAILASTGMLGQIGGESVQQGIRTAEEEKRLSQIGTAESEAEQKRLQLLGTARTTAESRIKSEREAYAKGGEALIGYLKEREGTRTSNTKKFVENAVASGIDLTKEDLAEYAQSLGVSKGDIMTAYKLAKAQEDKLIAEKAKADLERQKAEAEIKKTGAEIGKIGADVSKTKAETGMIPLTGEKMRADIAKTNAEIYKLQNPEKNYDNVRTIDGGLFDLEKGQWVVAPKNPQDEYVLDKDGRVFNKTKGVWADTGNTTAPTTSNIYANDTKITDIGKLIQGDSGILSAVGTFDRGSLSGMGALEGVQGKTQNFIAGVEQLIKGMTLQSLIDAKSQGATFGALSEGELRLLSDSASRIGTWAVKDDKGNITGYNIDENSFKQELKKIQDALKTDKALKLGKATGLSDNEIRRYISEYGADNTLEELQAEYDSGNTSGGGGTPKASTGSSSSAQSIVNAIKKTESSGNYGATGLSGETGAYQFMPSTWTNYKAQYEKSTGEKLSGQTPENQDKVALWKVQQWINQGYEPKQIASMWNAGEGRPDAWKNWKGVNALGVAYDTPAYVNKVLSNLG